MCLVVRSADDKARKDIEGKVFVVLTFSFTYFPNDVLMKHDLVLLEYFCDEWVKNNVFLHLSFHIVTSNPVLMHNM